MIEITRDLIGDRCRARPRCRGVSDRPSAGGFLPPEISRDNGEICAEAADPSSAPPGRIVQAMQVPASPLR